ncbi:PAS domain S-box protein [Loktanella salsilacus]|uniref:PAS domain-containing sensor histidine kinase n=1 Tax=Loktanella salsilacus TaxID=195913 RepID=UPI0030029A61
MIESSAPKESFDAKSAPKDSGHAPAFLGGGELGQRMCAFDWQTTPLGAPSTWPTALTTLVEVMLQSRQPMFLAWGDARTMLYNDAYATVLGARHPDALGRPFFDVWHDIIDVVKPIMDKAFAGESTHMDDLMLLIHRNGYPEEAHFAFSYTPVRGGSGTVMGMFCACTETTKEVMARRREIAESERLENMFAMAPSFMAILRGPRHIFEMTNAAYNRLIGRDDIIGRSVREALPDIAGQGFFEILDEVYATGQPFVNQDAKVTFQTSEDSAPTDRYVSFIFQPITGDDGEVTGVFIDGHDVTERMISQGALTESETRFREMADNAPNFIWMTEPSGGCTYVNQRWHSFTGQTAQDVRGNGWLDAVHPDDLEEVRLALQQAHVDHDVFELEYRLRQEDGTYVWTLNTAQPRFTTDGTFVGLLGSGLDIDERKDFEERQALMVRELHHRVKNTLATVQAIIGFTLRTSTDMESFRTGVSNRIASLARSHSSLTDAEWQGMDLRAVLRSELEPYDNGKRLILKGPRVFLSSDTVVPLTMAVHELTTNAVKYGALSNEDGQIEVRWSVTIGPEGEHLTLDWREIGGPEVCPPTRTGFGTTLLERLLGGQLNGSATMNYPAQGVEVQIKAQLRDATVGTKP